MQDVDHLSGYAELTRLFAEWRAFEDPPINEGAPDYTAARMQALRKRLAEFRARHQAIDMDTWSVPEQVDWHLLRAELNGLEFNLEVLQPWARDPAFYQTVWTYQSDTPAHEGPTNHALLELWTYEFPLDESESQRLGSELQVIPPLLAQARDNLTGNARDLWVSGIQNLRDQAADLESIEPRLGEAPDAELLATLRQATTATREFVDWLKAQASHKDGPSGVGVDAYNWHLQQVWYVPMTWQDEKRLLQRELHRAWSALKLEEHRNRKLPELEPAADPAAYERLADASATRLMRFLEGQDILEVDPWMEPALREHLGEYLPPEQRNFFTIGAHLDPTPLFTHFYHWFDLARMHQQPHTSPLRCEPLLYNIFTSRAEGMATAFEELTMHAGLHDDHPRAREIVWILLAQRAARGLGSLQAHANERTMAEAAGFHARWTPRQWMQADLEELDNQRQGDGQPGYGDDMNLLAFEQQLYLRQPGYGTSYITGKYLLERLMSLYGQQRMARNEDLVLSEFFAEFNAAGVIPMALIHWQMTGDASGIETIMATQTPPWRAAE